MGFSTVPFQLIRRGVRKTLRFLFESLLLYLPTLNSLRVTGGNMDCWTDCLSTFYFPLPSVHFVLKESEHNIGNPTCNIWDSYFISLTKIYSYSLSSQCYYVLKLRTAKYVSNKSVLFIPFLLLLTPIIDILFRHIYICPRGEVNFKGVEILLLSEEKKPPRFVIIP
jgi:hypothetical protein